MQPGGGRQGWRGRARSEAAGGEGRVEAVVSAARKPAVKTGRPPRRKAPAAPSTVVGALELELAVLAKRAPAVAGSALALSAVALARALDDTGVSATAKAACQRALRETIDRLHELAPAAPAGDRVDEISAKRKARRARTAAS